MDFLKRHWWWVITIGLAVVGSGVAGFLWYSAARQETEYSRTLGASLKELRNTTRYYNEAAAKVAKDAADYRDRPKDAADSRDKPQLAEIRDYLMMASSWKEDVLVPRIFPQYTDTTDILAFKTLYQRRLADLMQTLNAADPAQLSGGPIQVAMLAKPDAFYTAPWITASGFAAEKAVVMANVRQSQDDLWLQQDICRAIKQTNDTYFETADAKKQAEFLKVGVRTIPVAVVKELQQIGIGPKYDRTPVTGRSFSAAYVNNSLRYRYVAGGGPAMGGPALGGPPGAPGKGEIAEVKDDVRSPTLTGRASNNNGGRYKVLPFAIKVIADAGNYLELVRQLGGTRSFITVEDIDFTIIPEADAAYHSANLALPQAADRLKVYGPRALAVVVITGESLVFEHYDEKGNPSRPTLPPKTETAAAPGN
jgi:hypothetical protein